jgi:hypothetical protein
MSDFKIESWMSEQEIVECGIKKLSETEKQSLISFVLKIHNMLSPKIAEIEKIKYEGRLITLDDGSRYESQSSFISESWSEGDKVAIIDDKMFLLDESQMVEVEEED